MMHTTRHHRYGDPLKKLRARGVMDAPVEPPARCWGCGRTAKFGVCTHPHPNLDMDLAKQRGHISESFPDPWPKLQHHVLTDRIRRALA